MRSPCAYVTTDELAASKVSICKTTNLYVHFNDYYFHFSIWSFLHFKQYQRVWCLSYRYGILSNAFSRASHNAILSVAHKVSFGLSASIH